MYKVIAIRNNYFLIFVKPINRRLRCTISYTMDIFGEQMDTLIMRIYFCMVKIPFSEFLCPDEKIAATF
jgi:hypothetical protein